MSSQRIPIEKYISNQYDDYGKREYKKYLKLTDEELSKMESLRGYIDQPALFKRGKRNIPVIIMAVVLADKVYCSTGQYKSYPYQFRLNYADYKTNDKRMWDGFWTMNIKNLSL
jgi:hypothetical protein